MIELKRVGFFREMRLGWASDPSVEEAETGAPGEDAERVLGYLRGGHLYRAGEDDGDDASGGGDEGAVGERDEDGGERGEEDAGEGARLLTDGRFVWSSELIEYVQAGRVRLPDELLDHMAAFAWRVPEHIDLSRLTLPKRTPSFGELIGELRSAWPAIAAEIDVDAIRGHLVEAGRSLREMFETLRSMASDDTDDGDTGDDEVGDDAGDGGDADARADESDAGDGGDDGADDSDEATVVELDSHRGRPKPS